MIGNTLVLQVPAKINLSLDITGRRADGYHTLSSVFQTVSVYDTLTLTKTGAETPFSLTCNVDGIPCDERNLVAKAAVALLGESPCGVSIHLEKQIPSQAGMGGGSADCAAALLGIRKLLALPVTDEMLHAMAVKLGADVPFFLVGGTVLAQGIGDGRVKSALQKGPAAEHLLPGIAGMKGPLLLHRQQVDITLPGNIKAVSCLAGIFPFPFP